MKGTYFSATGHWWHEDAFLSNGGDCYCVLRISNYFSSFKDNDGYSSDGLHTNLESFVSRSFYVCCESLKSKHNVILI